MCVRVEVMLLPPKLDMDFGNNNNMRDKVNNYGMMIKPQLNSHQHAQKQMPEFNTHEMISRIP